MGKNGMIIWNVLLSVLLAWLLFQQFSGGAGKSLIAKKKVAASGGSFRMAYFEMDSVAANFELVKELKAEMLHIYRSRSPLQLGKLAHDVRAVAPRPDAALGCTVRTYLSLHQPLSPKLQPHPSPACSYAVEATHCVQ